MSDSSSPQALFDRLEGLYREVSAFLPKVSGNPCGTCRSCCTATGVNRQSLTDLELDYIADRVGPERVLAFRAFAARERDSQGEFLFDLCPYYDERALGCGIHAHRPLSCRLFGHYRLEGTLLPQGCSFIGQEKVVSRGGLYREIPLAGSVKNSSRVYWPRRGYRIVGQANRSGLESVERFDEGREVVLEDALDSALMALGKGDLERALEFFEVVGPEDQEPFRLHHLGVTLAVMERNQEANAVFRQCLLLAPESWDVHYNLGLNLYTLGDLQGAFDSFFQVTRLNPLHALAWGFLGYLSASAGLLQEASKFLEKAVELDPENQTFRWRLARLLHDCGHLKMSRRHLNVLLSLNPESDVEAQARALIADSEES